MAISAYTGLPGHGKSYGVVENVIKPALEKKRQVFTNIPMIEAECLKRFNISPNQFDLQEIIDNENWWSEVFIAGSVIVIDEVWRLWPSGLKANNVRDSDKEFLAEHRHLVGDNGFSTEIVLVTQDLSQIASFARALVENTYRVIKLSKIGMDKRYRLDVYFGAITGATPPVSKRENEIHGKFSKNIYSLYKSHTKSLTGQAGNESRTDNRYKFFGGFSFKLGLIAIVISAVIAYFAISYTIGYYGLKEEPLEEKPENLKPIPIHQNSAESLRQNIPIEPVFKFLSKADHIYIVFNNGHFPDIQYRFKVIVDSSESVFSQFQLTSLDYEVTPINECMVKIKGHDYIGFAMCQTQEREEGWIEDIFTQSDST